MVASSTAVTEHFGHGRDEEREAQRIEEIRSDERRRQEAALAAEHANAEDRKVREMMLLVS